MNPPLGGHGLVSNDSIYKDSVLLRKALLTCSCQWLMSPRCIQYSDVCVHVNIICVGPWCARDSLGELVLTVWVLELKLGLSGLAAITFTR